MYKLLNPNVLCQVHDRRHLHLVNVGFATLLVNKTFLLMFFQVFPSDKMPQYICNRCKFYMDLSFGFKQICRQADQNILHFVQNGTTIEPLTWPSLLNKVSYNIYFNVVLTNSNLVNVLMKSEVLDRVCVG